MPKYRRNYQKNGAYFFTVNLADRKAKHLINHFQSLRLSILKVKAERLFGINAWVILPDHMHLMWTMPEGDADYSMRWKAIKTRFTLANRSLKRPVWQHRFWEHTIRSQADFNAHMNYIHINPLKHGNVTRVKDWPYSSFHYWVRQHVYSIDWAGDGAEPEDGFFGE